jgi:hypothetical protein
MSAPIDAPAPRRAAPHRRRLTPLALITGVVGAVILAFSMNSSLAAFTAQIVNTVNTAAEGTLIMTETGPGTTPAVCTSSSGTNGNVGTNSANCATINKYGGSTTLVPGQTTNTTVTITNSGTSPAASFTLAPGTCTQTGTVTGSATDLCTQMGIVITQTVGGTTTTVTPAASTLTSIAGTTIALANPVAAGASVTFNFRVTLPVGSGNAYQGLQANQQLTWTFTS